MPARRLLALLAALLAAAPAAAQTYTWAGTTDGNWDTSTANWSGAGTVWANGTGNTAVFAGAGPTTVTRTAAISTGALSFTATGYAVGGSGSLTLGGASPSVSVSGGITATVTGPVTVANDLTVSGGGTLKLDGSFHSFDNSGGTQTITVAGASTLQFAGSLTSGNIVRDDTKLALGTAGTAVLGNPANGGNLTLAGLTGSAGSMIKNGATADQSSVTVNVAGGTTNSFAGTIGGGGSADNLAVTLTRIGSGTATVVLGGANTFTGQLAVMANVLLRITDPSALGGLVSNANVFGGSTLDLNGQVGVARTVFIQGVGVSGGGALVNSSLTTASLTGTLNLNDFGLGSAVGGAGNLTLAGLVSSAGRLDKVGAGTVTLSRDGSVPANCNDYAGGTRVVAGTLRLGATNALPANGAGTAYPVELAGGTLSTGATLGFSSTAGALSVTAAGSHIALGTGNHSLTFASFDPTGFAGLTIDGWNGASGGHLFFADTSAFSGPTLAAINFTGFGTGAMLSGTELVPVPEPALLLAVAVAGLLLRRRQVRPR